MPYPSCDDLAWKTWQFGHVGGPTAATSLRLERDGTIGGYDHFNEARWRLDDGILAFVAADGRVSSRFDRAERLEDDTIVLTGRFLLECEHPITLRLRQNPPPFFLTADRLIGSTWLMRLGAQDYPGEMRFGPDGSVVGSRHVSIARWSVQDGLLHLLDPGEGPFVTLEHVTTISDRLQLKGTCLDGSGQHVLELGEYRRLDDDAILGAFTSERPAGNTRDALAEWIKTCGWSIGEHSYGTPIVFEPTMAKLTVGRFTSIAAYVSIALGNHSMATATTYPFSSMPSIWPGAPVLADHETKGDVAIGSDVWIGAFAFIASGVTIGDGAVIGAHATVTRDVPPYAVVAGNPGRIIRYRFDPDVIADLLRIAWWNWDDRRIAACLPAIMSGDVRAFIARYGPRCGAQCRT